jgi:DNA-binding CsgD family transcriptional regulator
VSGRNRPAVRMARLRSAGAGSTLAGVAARSTSRGATTTPDDDLSAALAKLPLDDTAATVYAYAVRHGGLDALTCAARLGMSRDALRRVIDQLAAVCLLRPAPGGGGRYAALDPEVAAASLISPLEAEIYQRHALITAIRAEMGPLRPHFVQGHQRAEPDSSVRTVGDTAELLGSLHVATERCREEVLTVRSRRTRRDAALDAELVRDLSSLERGVRIRVLYQHAARADLATRSHIRRITAAGAEVRTIDQVPTPFVVFDREVAFVTDPPGSLEIGHGSLAHLLGDVFDSLWRTGMSYRPDDANYQQAANETQKTIARLLAEGLTDEVIARRLGVSARTCRRHIAALLRRLNAVSRFQAGALAAKRGLVADK